MTTSELYLKTIFCCIACDGDIAKEEVQLIKEIAQSSQLFDGVNVEQKLNQWIEEINSSGSHFLQQYLNELSKATLTYDEQLTLVDLAIKAIEADNRIEYSEVKFFKKIRNKLTVSDDDILQRYPDKEDLLLPDLNVAEEPIWKEGTAFAHINLANFAAVQNDNKDN